jgi:hypothetical protein
MARPFPIVAALILLLQVPRVPSTMEIIDSLQRIYREGVARELEPLVARRLEQRRVEQRKIYGMVLEDALRDDALGSLFTYLRGSLLMEFTLPDDTLWIVPPNPSLAVPGVPILEDREFPKDPWRRKSEP